MRRRQRSIWTNTALSVMISSAAGLAAALMCMALFAAFTYFMMDSMEFSDFFGSTAIAAGSLFGGYICGRYRRRRGIAEGTLCGIVMYAAGSVIGIIAAGSPLGIKKLLLSAVFAAIGGVSGVNSKRPRNLRND